MNRKILSLLMVLIGTTAMAQVANEDSLRTNDKIGHGFLTVYTIGNKYYFEIPDSILGRDILVISRVVKATAGSGINNGGQLGEQKVFRFNKNAKNKIIIEAPDYTKTPKHSQDPIAPAFYNSFEIPVVASFDITGYSKNGEGCVIDVTDQIVGGGVLVSGAATAVTSLHAYARSIEIEASRPFQSSVLPIHTTLLLLPKIPMRPRLYDARIGYYPTEYNDYRYNGIKTLRAIWRWRMEPRQEDVDKYYRGAIVEPQNPIIIYIDPATPQKWVPYLIQGINDWQAAFLQAGFKNAIIGKPAPTKEEDSTWSLYDAAHSAIIYIASEEKNAVGKPGAVDPRSGEILETHINWYHNLIKQAHDWYMVQASPSDPRARKMVFDDSLTGQMIRELVSHEVGHSLGLLHNLGSSSTVPVEKLRDKNWVKANGITPSIMDYARFNYVAQPEDSIAPADLFPRVGDYDKWAVEWGYRFFPQYKSAEEESAHLSKWTTEKLKNKRLWFGDGESKKTGQINEPRNLAEDLSDDPAKAADLGIKNLKIVMANLADWTKDGENETYDNLTYMYHQIIGIGEHDNPSGQFANYIFHVIKQVGGVYKTPRYDSAVYAYVPADRQKRAVDLLNRQLFTTPLWLADPNIIMKTGDGPFRLIGIFQNSALELLINERMPHLFDSEAAMGHNAYTADDLLTDLDKGIWSELHNGRPIDIYRRRVQETYINLLVGILSIHADATDALPLARKHLIGLQKDIKAACIKRTDTTDTAHLEAVLKKIDRALAD